MRPVRSAVPTALALLVASVTLAGCGSLFGRRYNNFRAYYNTYYNATRSLDEGERALLNTTTPVDRERLVELFPTGGAGGSNTTFDAAISKSAELLRQRPDSKWADDALLVIGKAYFYERNFAGAEQKFRETIDAAGIARDRRLADEARFWLGRTMAASDRYDEGVLVLREGLAEPDGDRYWQGRMHLALGELNARAGRWDAATVDLRDGLAVVRDADLGARAALLLGQVEEAAGRYDAAADAYQAALDRHPAYEIAFAAEINRGLVLGLDAGHSDDGLAVLDAMSRDDKNFQRRAEVALAQARVLAADGQPDVAETRFRNVLYDPALAGQSLRGAAHYRLAEFYRDVRGDYVTAAAHFDTAATALTAPPTAAQRPSRAAILGTTTLASTYQTVARTSLQIADIDSLLTLGSLDDDAFAARIAEIESVRRAEWVQQRREAEALRTAQDFGGTSSIQTPFGQAPSTTTAADRGVQTPGSGGSPGAAAGSTVETGFLGYRDPRTVQSGQLSFQRIYGDRPLVPNWRRRSAIQGAAGATAGPGNASEDFTPGPDGLSGPPPLDLSGIPRTPEEQQTLMLNRAALRYELANTFFLSLDRPDRAAVLYRQILDETPDAPVAPRARYALAELEAGAGRTDDAAPLYRDVAADSTSALGRAALARLDGREPTDGEAVAADDTAEAQYAAARQLWDDGDPRAAAHALVALGESDPDAPGAPRAFLAAALAYVEATPRDSVALAAPLPADLVPSVLVGVEARAPVALAPSGASGQVNDDIPISSAPSDDVPVRPRPGAPRPAWASRSTVPEPVGAPAPVGVQAPAAAPDSVGRLGADLTELSSAPDSLVAVAQPSGDPAVGSTVTGTTAAESTAVPDGPSAADTTAGPSGFTLRDYLTGLANRYPESPIAARARAIAATLPQPPDAEPPPTPEAPEVATVPREAYGGLNGRAPLNPLIGGVSWRLGPFETEGAARERLGTLPVARIRFAIGSDDEQFFLIFGQFPDVAAAEEAAETAPSGLLTGAEALPISDLSLIGVSSARPEPGALPPPPASPASSVQDAVGGTSLPTLTPPSDEPPAPPLDPAPPAPNDGPTDTPLPVRPPEQPAGNQP